MTPAITVDLRGYDFETVHELEQLVADMVPAIREDFPGVMICGLVISEHQQKLLRLERYMQGVPRHIVRTEWINRVNGVPVIVAADHEPAQCDAGDIHDSDQPWYHGR